MNVSISCLTLIGALALPLLAQGQVYKWVDPTGVVTYGNKPPPNAAGVARLPSASSLRPRPAWRARVRLTARRKSFRLGRCRFHLNFRLFGTDPLWAREVL